MTDNAKRLLKVFVKLSEDDRREVLEKIKEYQSSNFTEKAILLSQINESRILGPVASGLCPYCGR